MEFKLSEFVTWVHSIINAFKIEKSILIGISLSDADSL